MSQDNFDDVMHIIKKINFFLGMCLQDIDHLNYTDNERRMLKMFLNLNGKILLNNMVEAAAGLDKISKDCRTVPELEVTNAEVDKVQEEWDKVFKHVGKKRSQTEDTHSEGQASKKNVEKGTGDPRDPKEPEEDPFP